MKKKCCPPDIISSLPESIRNHIISFLPMEDAIRTSILSKYWRSVCSSLPNLDFDQDHLERKLSDTNINYKDIVYRTIVLRDDVSNIQKFKLSVDVSDGPFSPHLNSWTSFAVKHNVKEFSLSVLFGKLDTLPCCLFTCKTLTVLNFHGVNLNLPTVVGLPMLKILKLSMVVFSDDTQTNTLISSCPLLEDLDFNQCSWSSSDTIVIHAHNLKKLKLIGYSRSHEVKVSCSNLRDINYIGNPPEISSETLSSLLYASFVYFPPLFNATKIAQDVLDRRVSKILLGLRNVVSLELHTFCIEILSKDADLLSHLPNLCCCLKVLHLREIFATKKQVHFLIFLLRSCPNLQTLRIFFNERNPAKYAIDMQGHNPRQESSAEGRMKHLKTVELSHFKGTDNELYLAKHLFQHVKPIEKINIIYSSELDALTRMAITTKLEQF